MPALQININANNVPSPNGSGAKMSRSGANSEPNQVNWKAAQACTVTFPKGFFVGAETQDLVITFGSGGGTSSTQTLLTNAPVGNATYTITGGSPSGPPDPPMIEIDN